MRRCLGQNQTTDEPLPFAASLKAVLQRIKITFDANVFPREVNKLSDLGMTNKRKMLFATARARCGYGQSVIP